MQAVRHLLASGATSFNVNEKNLEDKTALDILERQRTQGVDNSEMRVILDGAGALTASSLLTVTSPYAHYLSEVATPETVVKEPLSDEKRNALVVAALLVTVTYQAVLSPLGDFGQMIICSYPTPLQLHSALLVLQGDFLMSPIPISQYHIAQGQPLLAQNHYALFGCSCFLFLLYFCPQSQ